MRGRYMHPSGGCGKTREGKDRGEAFRKIDKELLACRELESRIMDPRFVLDHALNSPYQSVRTAAAEAVMDPKLIPELLKSKHPEVRALGEMKCKGMGIQTDPDAENKREEREYRMHKRELGRLDTIDDIDEDALVRFVLTSESAMARNRAIGMIIRPENVMRVLEQSKDLAVVEILDKRIGAHLIDGLLRDPGLLRRYIAVSTYEYGKELAREKLQELGKDL